MAPSIRKLPWRRKWQPTPAFLSGKSHGQRGLVSFRPWGCKESDTTEHAHTHSEILQSRNYALFVFILSVMPDTEKCLSFKKNLVNVY